MNIGIFSKMGSVGGSENRAVEMANGIVRHTSHTASLLCEDDFNPIMEKRKDNRVGLVKHIFLGSNPTPEALYDYDMILVINTDSYSFSRVAYWEGRECWPGVRPRHRHLVYLSKIPQMIFLYNFIIKPVIHLKWISEVCPDVKIICANTQYYDTIMKKKRYEKIRHIPTMILDSPINPDTVSTQKTPSDRIRIGRHSQPHLYKFNSQNIELIQRINKKFGDKIIWDFMGLPEQFKQELSKIDNVILREPYTVPIKEYLMNLDIMLFFIDWKREEPWARVVAEGMASGCPILATNKFGNQNQIRHKKNGYLCNDLDLFEKFLSELIENPQKIKEMGSKGIEYSKEFTTEKVIKKYLEFTQL